MSINTIQTVSKIINQLEIQTFNSYLSFAIKAQDLKADAGGAPSLNFMQVSEKVESCSSSTVVQLPLCQNPKQGRLPRVHITQHCHSQIQELLAVQKPASEDRVVFSI